MFLKQIEILGFKSFGQKTVLDIKSGITAIVGPNGCGKSNIVDAIKWVLGEQSPRELRGSSMQDIIFNGTTDLPALGMAEVSLIIEDTENQLPLDYTEIRVTRRLFRNGESQYLINKKPCRLKDIQELFMDTGIGNDSYAIMVQGKMDQVLTAKPEDRRVFFEEAAGITKYKTRRNEALRKLQRTEENLTRVNDIIRELEKNISSLKIKAGKAKKYQECFERLKDLETRFTFFKAGIFRKDISELSSLKERKEQTIHQVREAIALQEKQLHEIRSSLEESDGTYRKSFEEMSRIHAKIEQSIQEKILDEKRSGDTLAQKSSLLSDIERLSEKATETLGLLEELAVSENEFVQSLEEKKRALDEKEQFIQQLKEDIEQTQKAMEDRTNQSLQAAQKESHLKNQMIDLSATTRNMESQQQKIQADVASLSRYLAQIDHTIETRLQEVLSLKHALEEEESRKSIILKNMEQAKSELDADEQKLFEKKASLSEKTSRLKALDKLEKGYEGFLEGIKKIMELRQDASQGIIGTVSDILSVDKAHADMVEMVLGNRIQNIIVEKADQAAHLIQAMKNQQMGCATFLPLDSVKNEGRVTCENQEGLIGHILDFIQWDDRYSPVVHHLFGRTFIVKDLWTAIRLARTVSQPYDWVTLEGDHVSSTGLLTGGNSKGAVKGIISRKSEIRSLEQQISEEEISCGQIRSEADKKKKHLEILSGNLLQCEKILTEKQMSFHEKDSAAREEKLKFDSTQKNMETLSSELNIIRLQLQEMKQKEDHFHEELSLCQHSSELLQKDILEYKSQIEQKVRDIEALREGISEIRIQKASISEKLESMRKRKHDHQMLAEETNREIQKKQQETLRLTQIYEDLQQHIVALAHEVSQKEEEEKSIQEMISKIEDDRNRLRKDEELMSEGIHNNNVKQQLEQEELSSLNIQLTEKEGHLSHIIENFRLKYEEDLPEVPVINDGESGALPENLEEEIEALRKKMKYLGPVSLDAIKEYDELQERYTFLQSQHSDLHNAKVDLIKIINRLNKQAKEQFAENFEKIRQLFKEIFTSLFRGGRADIYLVDENDILESGIEITAKPPGKPNQSISLLSGGEKALSSIALLFAIFKLKPSFFSVLDELDASLDESNILRFLELLKSFTEKTQFLIITHSKTTINIADTIYGITMSTPGLSTIVSASLKEKPVRSAQKKQASKKKDEPLWENQNGPLPAETDVSEDPSRIDSLVGDDRLSHEKDAASERQTDIVFNPEES
ncbi:MAG: chromosome segregation protein SMC [Candidatus Aureabacteria bacterium]|nr:chromosome segregation protein SMC [Candidatus Auribacterota bacterium]